jgi:hypothetical protein
MRFLACILGLLAGVSSLAIAAQAKSESDFFQLDRVHTFHLKLSRQAWDTMQPTRRSLLALAFFGPATHPTTRKVENHLEGERQPANPFGLQYAYVKGLLDYEATAFADVGVRFKGNSSYLFAGNDPKRPFKIDFDRFVPEQKLLGLSKLNFHVNAYDSSMLREAMSYAVFRDCGVPASRTTHAALYLTVDGLYENRCLGIYTVVEEVDKHFLKSHFKSSKGLLLKPENARDLPYLGEDWTRYDRYDAKSDASPKLTNRVIAFTRLIHNADDAAFARQITDYLDVDEFLRFLAANTLLANLDSFLVTGHNYYLYVHPDTGRIHWIPWDLNLSFGHFEFVGNPKELANLAIDTPYVEPNTLVKRLLAIAAYKQAYHEHLKHLVANTFNTIKLGPMVDKLSPIVLETENLRQREPPKLGFLARKPEPHRGDNLGRAASPLPIKEFISLRTESIQTQLAGQTTGYIPSLRFGRILGLPDFPDAVGKKPNDR